MIAVPKKWRMGAVGLAAAAIVSVPAVAFARSATSPTETTSRTVAPAAVAAGGAFGALGTSLGTDAHGGPRADLDALATALGVTPEALRAALESVKSTLPRPEAGADRTVYQADVVAALAQALGLNATTVQTAVDANGLSFGGRGHRDGGAKLDTLATTLGVTTDALQAALETAKSAVERPAPGGDRAAYRTAIAGSVASTLGLDTATVEAALGDGGGAFGGRGHRDGGAKLDTLATTLGVTTGALQAALETAKSAVERPAPGGDLAAYRTAIASSIASTLGLDAATVESALGDGGLRPGGRGHHRRGVEPGARTDASGGGGFRPTRGQSA